MNRRCRACIRLKRDRTERLTWLKSTRCRATDNAAPARTVSRRGRPVDMSQPHRSLLDTLQTLANDPSRERILVSDLVSALGERAVASFVLLFALPNVLPVPPGTSFVLGAPLLFFTAQAALGKPPWLPHSLARRSMARVRLAAVLNRIQPWLGRVDGLLRPRLQGLVQPACARLIGALCVVLALILFLPIPLGNIAPAIAISMLALGILERDGLWVLGGIAIALTSIALAWSVTTILAKVGAALLLRVFGQNA